MSEPRQHEPGPPKPPDPPPGPEHHGIGEEIRHELEEAVEHVPQPIRWTVGKLVSQAWYSPGAFTMTVMGAVSPSFRTRGSRSIRPCRIPARFSRIMRVLPSKSDEKFTNSSDPASYRRG